jgi:molybdopterin synthase catalytic subunit
MDRKGDVIALQSAPLDVGASIEGGEDNSGAIAVFLGTTREETGATEAKLIALDYEAYGEMAEAQMRQLAGEARDRWPISRVVMLHRIGVVEVGRPSVLVAVWTPHRAEAFEACRYLIDRLKAEAAIWKREIWADGSRSWVGMGG